jgi:acetolactate synthase I/II/III large subunit
MPSPSQTVDAPPQGGTLAEEIAAEVRGAGIERAFGIPGGEVLSLIEALERGGTEFVLCNHESSAGMMAAAYGQLSGAPGLVLTTLGPGAANLLLPLANSQLDREALVAICGDLSPELPSSHTHQRMDLLGVFGPTTKYAAALRPESGGADDLRAAIRAAAEAPRGGALLTLSTSDANAKASEAKAPQRDVPVEMDPVADADRIASALAAAERPLVIVGCGAGLEGSADLRRWLDAWDLPVAVTPKAKGMVRGDGERYCGVLDGAGLGKLMGALVAEADLIVGLGLDPVELIRPWHSERPLIWVGNCGPSEELDPEAEHLTSRVADVVATLAERPAAGEWADWTAGHVAARRAMQDDPALLTWVPKAIGAALPADAIVTTDVGSHKCLASQFLEVEVPGSFLTSNGLSAMGYGIPAAIGAKLARPAQPVVAVVGDGGVAMAAQELETAVRMGAPFVTVAIVDTALSLIEQLQRMRGLPRAAVDYGPVDLGGLAEAYGAHGVTAADPASLTAAIESGFEADRPTVIAVPIDGSGYDGLL